MSEPRTHPTPGETDETLVTPRFDEEETVLAQPVVPLDAPAEGVPARPSYLPRARALGRQWPLALALVSALVGGVIGGLGLYLFQQYERATPAPAGPQAGVTQPSPAPTVEQAAQAAPAADEVSAPVETAPAAEPGGAEDSPEDEAAPPRDDGARDEDRAAAPRPPVREAPAPGSAPKRGKKGERDAELQRRQRSTPPDSNPPAMTEGGARRVDTIVYPSRRAARRERRATRSVDRVRAIFEGQPE
ncbi:MAG TPA: hypothetical protein VG148_06120 [Pyrinomonadaceae bacterium]|nr:hypothetical protein [Pyrinomonadaceae bacterium]